MSENCQSFESLLLIRQIFIYLNRVINLIHLVGGAGLRIAEA